eukprot:gene4273-3090_t
MTEANAPLTGVVSKAPLLVAPSFAQEKELLHYIKYKLYEEGFVVVREEFRQINPELSEKLCIKVDYVPPYFQEEPKPGEMEATLLSPRAEKKDVVQMAPKDMVGTAYIFILARGECHQRLVTFLEKLLTEDETFRRMVADRKAALTAEGVPVPLVPLMSNTTPNGARQAVNLLFPQMLAMDIPTAVRAREYVQANLKTALLSALTELAKAKPANPLEWLAQRLLETNIQAPPMETS